MCIVRLCLQYQGCGGPLQIGTGGHIRGAVGAVLGGASLMVDICLIPLSLAYTQMSAIKEAPPKTAPHGPPNMAPRANLQRATTALIWKTEPKDADALTPEGRPFPVPPEIFRGGPQRLKRLKRSVGGESLLSLLSL